MLKSSFIGRIRSLFLGKVQLDHPHHRFGSEYGGWNVISDPISKDSIVYSCGVGTDISFDLELIQRYSLVIHAFDPTPRSMEWVSSQDLPEGYRFHPIGIADFDGRQTFFAPENPDHVSYSIRKQSTDENSYVYLPVNRLKTIMHDLGHSRVDILKMDIEGAEYAVIRNMLATGITPHQVLVEFHHRFQNAGILKTGLALRLLEKHGYRIFSISPDYQEYSFFLTR